MQKSMRTRVAAVAVLAMTTLAVAPSVSAAPRPREANLIMQPTDDALHATSARPTLSARQLAELGDDLKSGPAKRDIASTSSGQRVTYRISDHVDISFSYDTHGQTVVSPPMQIDPGSSLVAIGADPFPYVSLDSTEQATGAAGAAGTLAFAICAALGPESGGIGCGVGFGIGATIVSIVTSHGLCSRNRNMRIYLPSLEVQCRND
jgi:hypothetical protein